MAPASGLRAIVAVLEKQYAELAAPPPRAPFEWVLWENVAYLVDDERRLECYRALEKRVGLTAEEVAKASRATLLAIASRGGMHPEKRVDTLLECAEIALRHGGGDLSQVLELPLAQARKVLREFHGIGAPGAEAILLACGVACDASTGLALESNGLRTLLRLGYGAVVPGGGGYAREYRSVQDAVAKELVRDAAWLARARELLRAHGKLVCTRSSPDCDVCPLTKRCAWLARAR